jgi:nitronate monooxygenase
VRVIANSVTADLDGRFLGHRPDDLPREEIAKEDDRPIYLFSTDSPLRNTRGALERLALFAGQVAGAIERISSAEEVISNMVMEAERRLDRLQGGKAEAG